MSKPQYLYIDPFTDFGFKKLFMNPDNKVILIQYLNAVMDRIGESQIVDLVYLPPEHQGLDDEHKKVIQDLECVTSDGRFFIVEVQCSVESDFRDRMAFYGFRASIDGVKVGERYKLRPVYCLVLMEEQIRPQDPDYLQVATFRFENSQERFLHYPIFVFMEAQKLPIHKPDERSLLEHLCYCMAHMGEWSQPPNAKEIPESLEPLLSAAKLANFSAEEQKQYYKSLDQKRDMKYALEHKWETGHQEGFAKGEAKGKAEGEATLIRNQVESIQKMLAKGCAWDFITDVTGISESDWPALQEKSAL